MITPFIIDLDSKFNTFIYINILIIMFIIKGFVCAREKD